MIRRPPRSTQSRSSAASDVYKRQAVTDPAFLETDEAPTKTLVEAMGPQDVVRPGPIFVLRPGTGQVLGLFLLDQSMGRKTQMSDMDTELKQYLEAGPSAAPKDALEFAEGTETKIVDLKFVDLLGRWQHVSLSLKAFDEAAFTEGLGFDGSSIRGWQAIDKSDMLLVPDPASAIMDPFTAVPTLSLICDIRDPITGGPYDKDPVS